MAGNAPLIPGCRDLSLIGERVARSLFSATSDRLGRPVTVTLYPPLGDGRTREGFDAAAAQAQRLGVHPSVITIHEWGFTDDGRPWVVSDPQPAHALDTVLTQEGPLEPERALQVGVLLAGALETAHTAGIVHGDLSPSRLVLGAHGEPLLAETGLAEFAVFPGLGALNNPVRYHAPPEVLERTDISPATDVYSLVATVYALVAGRAPQQKPAEVTDSNASLLLRILQMPVPRIDRPDLPPGLHEALQAGLAPDPRKRPQQAIEVAWHLQDVQRRAGFAVTEPVVLDLDDIEHHRSPRAGAAASALAAPAAGPWTPDIGPILPDPWAAVPPPPPRRRRLQQRHRHRPPPSRGSRHRPPPSHGSRHRPPPSHGHRHRPPPSHGHRHRPPPSHGHRHRPPPSHGHRHRPPPSHGHRHRPPPSHGHRHRPPPSHGHRHRPSPYRPPSRGHRPTSPPHHPPHRGHRPTPRPHHPPHRGHRPTSPPHHPPTRGQRPTPRPQHPPIRGHRPTPRPHHPPHRGRPRRPMRRRWASPGCPVTGHPLPVGPPARRCGPSPGPRACPRPSRPGPCRGLPGSGRSSRPGGRRRLVSTLVPAPR